MTATVPTVLMVATCDRCARPGAIWLGSPAARGGTNYEVDCPHCRDTLATFTAQLLRRRHRRMAGQ